MILGNKKYKGIAGVHGEYRITDIYKKPDGSIDSFQVEIVMMPGTKTFPVILNETELYAVADNIPAAYQYIQTASEGRKLISFMIDGAYTNLLNEYQELCGFNVNADNVSPRFCKIGSGQYDKGFHIKTFSEVNIVEFCNNKCHFPMGFHISPRFRKISNEYWYDEVWGGTYEASLIDVGSPEQYLTAISGLLWLDNDIIDKRLSMNNTEFTELLIRTFEDNYYKAYEEARPKFEERFKAFVISLNKEDEENGKKEV